MNRNKKRMHLMESGVSPTSNSKAKVREKIHVKDVEEYLEDMKLHK